MHRVLLPALMGLCLSAAPSHAAEDPAEVFARLERLLLAGEYAEVERGAREFLPEVEKTLGRYSVETAWVLDLLVEARLRMGPQQAGQAPLGESLLDYARRAVSVKQRLLRHDDPEVATSVVNLGAVLLQEDAPSEALQLFRSALEIREKALGSKHALVGESHYYIGLAAAQKEDAVEAREAFERALAVWEQTVGPSHPSAERCVAKLGELAWEAGDFDTASEHYTRDLDLLEQLYGAQHPRTIAVRNRLAALSLTTGNRERARAIGIPDVQELVLWQLRELGPEHGEAWYRDYRLGERAFREQNWEQSIRHLVHSIEKRARPEVEASVPDRGTVAYHPYLKLGIAYYNLGQVDLAMAAFDDEERLGAVSRNPAELSNLRKIRELAGGATTVGAGAVSITSVIDSGLSLARELEAQGRLDEALTTLGRSLAAAPESSRVNAAMERIRLRLAEQERAAELQNRLARLVGEGTELLEAGDYEQASAVLSQAMSLDPDPKIKARLDESQRKLSQRIRAERDTDTRRQDVLDGLREAAAFEQQGKLPQALSRLQSVLALDASNPDANRMRDRLLKLQAGADERRTRSETVSRLLEEGLALVGSGESESAADRFSRVLALDPTNESARRLLRTTLGAIAPAAAGGTNGGAKIPPIIVLANLATALDGPGPPEERTAQPRFTLSGIIDDDQPELQLIIRVLDGADGPEGRIVHEATLASEGRRAALYRYQFQHAMSLQPGVHTLAVTAGDSDGLSSEVVHRVRYVRPLYRSPLFYAGFGVVALGAIAGTQGYRVRRRRRLIRRRFNPYAAGAPILNEELFFGREALLSRVIQTIPNNSLLLYGERRIGKTSLQHQLKRRLETMNDPVYEFFPVYIDLEGTPQERFFATLAHEVFDQLDGILEELRPATDPAEDPAYDYHRLVRDIRAVLKRLRERSNRRVKLVLLIDEVDELNYYDPRINQKLRSLFMKSFAEDLVAVVSGVGIKKDWEREGSPWFNFFEEVEVRPFADEHARELIEKPIRGVFEFEDGVVARIIQQAERKPYLIQKLCVSVVNRMHEQGRRRITMADVELSEQTFEG
jgi:tetratricopeptide (TPR) repeat protein